MIAPDADLNSIAEQVDRLEGLSDRMEAEIGRYLSDVSDAHLSDDTKAKVRSMFRQINEMESIGDSCQAIARILKRQTSNGERLTDELLSYSKDLLGKLYDSLQHMDEVLKNPDSDADTGDRKAVKTLSNSLREKNIALSGAHSYS